MQRPNIFATFILSLAAFASILAWAASSGASPSDRARQDLEQRYNSEVRPVIRSYCIGCHGKSAPQAQLDLTSFTDLSIVEKEFSRWELLAARLEAKQMPPPAVTKRPSAAQCAAIISWVRALRKYDAARDAGDPGTVLAHRLSNAEYNNTIRDLTGQDLRPAKDFPVDPANEEGFDNTGESLTLSPALIKKYMQAARDISDHLVLTSTGIEFASHPVLVETDRDKFCILRIVDFYKRQPTDYAAYFQAAWRYRYRASLGEPSATLHTVAARAGISPAYLDLVWQTLHQTDLKVGPVAKLQALWNALPTPDARRPELIEAKCTQIREWTLQLRKKLAWKFPNLRVPRGFSDGGQCFVLWKDREYASHRRMLNPAGLQIDGVPATHEVRSGDGGRGSGRMVTDPVDPDQFVPGNAAARAPYTASFERFCSVFPDAFYISERGRMFVDDPGDKGRLLSAGLHNSMGYFRDDTPLMELILDDAGRKKLDHMWLDFDQVAYLPERMHREFFHYERAESGTIISPEFNSFKAEDKDITSDARIKQFEELYLAKARRNMSNGEDDTAIQAIEDHFDWVRAHIRATQQGRLAAEPLHIAGLLDFAARAYRRPLTAAERADTLAFYHKLRTSDGLTHEDAMRDSIASILMSPRFLFRADETAATADSPGPRTAAYHSGHASDPPATAVEPLSDYALASRLSYFLWASMPDRELLAHAAAGDLHRPEVLLQQAHRMLKDNRVRGLALEFGGNWLDFRRFEEHNAVDRNRFPQFTDNLREAMFEEPLHLLTDEFQNDRSVLDLVFGNYTFVNGDLARHYGMDGLNLKPGEWARVDDAGRYGRGGLLPMAVFLTENSPGLRTSPVKRGYWVVRKLLGEYIPPPPATVPQLPSDESHMGDLTLREALEQHRKNPACAACHARFDSYGLVFEGYGPVGERRTKDLGGKIVDTKAPFPGGAEYSGVSGLQAFIRKDREKDFVDTFSRKLLSYALGRSLQPSDDAALAEMRAKLSAGGDRFDVMIDTIVLSKQFRNRRAAPAVARG